MIKILKTLCTVGRNDLQLLLVGCALIASQSPAEEYNPKYFLSQELSFTGNKNNTHFEYKPWDKVSLHAEHMTWRGSRDSAYRAYRDSEDSVEFGARLYSSSSFYLTGQAVHRWGNSSTDSQGKTMFYSFNSQGVKAGIGQRGCWFTHACIGFEYLSLYKPLRAEIRTRGFDTTNVSEDDRQWLTDAAQVYRDTIRFDDVLQLYLGVAI